MAVSLNRLIDRLGAVACCGNRKAEVESVFTDSRQVRPGSLFAALRGAREDGWRFVDDALKRGAVAVLSEHTVPRLAGGICHIQVADAHEAAGLAAAMVNGNPADALQTVAVTGTNGKTTVSCLIRDMLKATGHPVGLIGTIQYEVGSRVIPAARTTPDAATLQPLLRQMVEIGCTHAVMEVSSHAIQQRRIAGIAFGSAVFTNLTRDHLDYHGTMEAYFEAKAALFRGLSPQATAIVNVDDPWGRQLLAEPLQCRLLRYGIETAAEVAVTRYRLNATGAVFSIETPWGRSPDVTTPLLGRYNLANALAAVAACGTMGVPLDAMLNVLAGCKGAPGRLEPVPTGRDFHVFVDYAHTDDALANVLTALREVTPGRLIVVFGCGGNRDVSKRPAMGCVAATLADRVIITSDNPRREDPASIMDDILAGITDPAAVTAIESRSEAIALAVQEARPGDVVLLAGKGHEQYQEFADRTVPFDDRQKAKEALDAIV